jgi:hypothetical protein
MRVSKRERGKTVALRPIALPLRVADGRSRYLDE